MGNCKTAVPSLFLSFLLFAVLPLLNPVAATAAASSTASPHNISAIFVFGDSTLDSGNNNNLSTLVRADHPPYGIDFPGHVPSGRFSNGRLITDFLASSLGLKDFLPPYSDVNLTTADLATGVSFASAGSGLDYLTSAVVDVKSMTRQVGDFVTYIGRLRSIVGEKKADQIVEDALFVIGSGSNDMMNFYQLPIRRLTFNVSSYQDFLLHRLQSLVEQLYERGGRKFTIAGLPPLGCLPIQRTLNSVLPGPQFGKGACAEQQNNASATYNTKLRDMIRKMQASLQSSKLVYVDIYNPMDDMIKNPKKHGFVETTRGCCATGLIEMGPMCNSHARTCLNTSTFMFWDSVHPSQATYQAIAKELMETVLPQIIN